MRPLFITGTGTDVGKTVVSAALCLGRVLRGGEVRYWKPVQTGDDSDAARVKALAGDEVRIEATSFAYPLPASPDQAARAASRKAPTIAGLLNVQADVVEGAGGLLVPLNDDNETWADLLAATRWPTLVVASTGLGTINHTSLTLRELDRRGIPVAGVVLSGAAHAENLASLQRLFPATRFHHFPQQAAALAPDAARNLAAFVDDALAALDRDASPTDWLAADARNVWHPYTQHRTAPEPLPVVAAHGARLTLADGTSLIDGTSSWWVNNAGHGRRAIGDAIARQQATLDHVLFAGATHAPGATLAAELIRLAGAPLTRVFYSDNGSTAVEVALKIAYQAWAQRGEPQRTRFLAFRGSYHGDTFGTMAVAAAEGFHGVFKPFLFSAEHADAPRSEAEVATALAAIEQRAASLPLAAVIIEPLVQGAGGMRFHPPSFLAGLAAICRRHRLPLILDEVMTGFGRTGATFAFQRAGVTPDLVCIAKGLTGGTLPLAATIATEELFAAFLADDKARALLHGHSFTANPIACAAALASLALQRDERLPERALRLEQRYQRFIAEHAAPLALVAPRALGGILAFELPGSSGADYFHPRAGDIARLSLAEGLFIRPLGNTVYLMPPLTITDEELETALAALAHVVRTVTAPT